MPLVRMVSVFILLFWLVLVLQVAILCLLLVLYVVAVVVVRQCCLLSVITSVAVDIVCAVDIVELLVWWLMESSWLSVYLLFG